jgi:nitronate monooxygenase
LTGIVHPIVQAPMSGFTSPTLASSVSNAGGLGSLGTAALSADAVREQVTQLRAATNQPFNLNFFVHLPPILHQDVAQRVGQRLARYFDEFGLGPVPEPVEPFPTFDEDRLALVLELRPRVVSLHFGTPQASAIRRIRRPAA